MLLSALQRKDKPEWAAQLGCEHCESAPDGCTHCWKEVLTGGWGGVGWGGVGRSPRTAPGERDERPATSA